MAKESKNLAKVQSMLDGTYGGKIQSGYTHVEEHKKVGDKWVDSDGNHWEQKEGYRTKNTREGTHHSWDMKCSGCEKLIVKKWDKDTHKGDGRCYHCQLNYELDLKYDKPIRWFAYRRLKDLINMEALHNDMEKWVFAKYEFEKDENIFDKSVANALANGEVDLQLNKVTNKLV